MCWTRFYGYFHFHKKQLFLWTDKLDVLARRSVPKTPPAHLAHLMPLQSCRRLSQSKRGTCARHGEPLKEQTERITLLWILRIGLIVVRFLGPARYAHP